MIKGRLRVEDRISWHGHKQEGVWVKLVIPIAEKAIAEICNIPFFSNVISMGDKIAVALHKGEVVFHSIVERGGHSTYRIFMRDLKSFDSEGLTAAEGLGRE